MSSPASIARHPLHPILIPLPIGLWVFSVVADLVFLFGWGGTAWKEVAWYTMGGGIVGAVLAAVPGLIDFFSITDRRAGRVALFHLVCNVTALLLFVLSFVFRYRDPLGGGPVVVSAIGVIALGIGGWLGGELVFVHGMGVKPPNRR
jgi:uncharacterized membrane protein